MKRRRRADAFTLIEVLLTTVLAATLLAALGALMSMYAKTFEVGQTKTEQSQLARALFARMSEDLHGVVQPPPPVPPLPVLVAAVPSGPAGKSGAPSAPGGQPPQNAASTATSSTTSSGNVSAASPNTKTAPSANSSAGSNPATPPPANPQPPAATGNSMVVTSSLRPSGLFGTESYLQIDILQPTVVPPDVDRAQRAPSPGVAPSRAPELRTVAYSLEEIRDPSHPLGHPRMCLTRREVDWEQAHPGTRGVSTRRGRRENPATDASGPGGRTLQRELRSDGVPDETANSVPEVMWFGVRYFDGTTWAHEWDSVARQGLPLAVEVAMQLRSFDEPEPQPHHAAGESIGEDPEIKLPKFPMYRLLIHLPSATQQKIGSHDPSNGGRMHGGAARPREAESHAQFR